MTCICKKIGNGNICLNKKFPRVGGHLKPGRSRTLVRVKFILIRNIETDNSQHMFVAFLNIDSTRKHEKYLSVTIKNYERCT